MVAHAYYVKKHALQYLAKKNSQATWDFMLGINQGSRYRKEKKETQGLPAIELAEGPHVAKVMACFDEYFREQGENVASAGHWASEARISKFLADPSHSAWYWESSG
jgi:hypothetical protein